MFLDPMLLCCITAPYTFTCTDHALTLRHLNLSPRLQSSSSRKHREQLGKELHGSAANFAWRPVASQRLAGPSATLLFRAGSR